MNPGLHIPLKWSTATTKSMQLAPPSQYWHSIINMPFPRKLWLMFQIERDDIIRWDATGTVVMVNPIAFQEFLQTDWSPFRLRRIAIFYDHMKAFQFECFDFVEKYEHNYLCYRNRYFKRDHFELLYLVQRRHEPFDTSERSVEHKKRN